MVLILQMRKQAQRALSWSQAAHLVSGTAGVWAVAMSPCGWVLEKLLQGVRVIGSERGCVVWVCGGVSAVDHVREPWVTWVCSRCE